MNRLKQGWFSELSEYWPGQAFSLEVEEVLYQERSPFQEVLVFRSKNWGNVLVIDNAIQATERDEFAYQEMIAHIPIFSHPNPKRVLVVGGGDGGVLREIIKHPEIEEITLCEIDQCVIDASKKYLPKMAVGFMDPRVKVIVGDGLQFMRDQGASQFDVIITDSSDPIGPAEGLFGREYYQLMKRSLRQGGIVCSQAESMWLHLDTIKDMFTFTKDLFNSVEYAYASVPSYPSGTIGFLVCSDSSCKSPVRSVDSHPSASLFQYYSTEVHQASFVLPAFTKKLLN